MPPTTFLIWFSIIPITFVSSAKSPIANDRVDCSPDLVEVSQKECTKRGCLYNSSFGSEEILRAPQCYFRRTPAYSMVPTSNKTTIVLKSNNRTQNPFGRNISPLTVTTMYIGATLNVRIGAPNRFEPQLGLPYEASKSDAKLVMSPETMNGGFYFTVKRLKTPPQATVLWNTSIAPMLFADQYIQIATYLPSTKVFGFGENVHRTLQHDFSDYTTWSMFSRDEPPDASVLDTRNLYGVHMFYLCVEQDYNAHGVFILNSNAQEITTGPAPHLVYRTIGGLLDVYFFPGPKPEQVIQQYLSLIGTPFLPAYWALGFQLGRRGYGSLAEMNDTVGALRQAGIPVETQYLDIDTMDDYKDFTTAPKWSKIGDYVKQMHANDLHVIQVLDSSIQVEYEPFNRAIKGGASFIEWPNQNQVPQSTENLYPSTRSKKIMLGISWPSKHVAFPDFNLGNSLTNAWWSSEIQRFYKTINFDGLALSMNEPTSFGTNSNSTSKNPALTPLQCPLAVNASAYDNPPYKTHSAYDYPNGELSSKTLCMLAKTSNGKQRFYDTKDLYGITATFVSQQSIELIRDKRPTVISRSTFASSGRYGGHWLGDNRAQWSDLQDSIIAMIEFNMFGIPYVGADICGYYGNTNMELCLRWQQLGAFYPLFRNYNSKDSAPQHPTIWGEVADATREANYFRYRYLPYLYSLHVEAALYGGTVIRPLFFEFPDDEQAYTVPYQFMWGNGIMVVPVVNQGLETASTYFPSSSKWYSLGPYDYGFFTSDTQFTVQYNEMLPVFARAGVIIPRQLGNLTISGSRKNPLEILVPPDYDNQTASLFAFGKLYWDDGESVLTANNYYEWHFSFNHSQQLSTLHIKPIKITTTITIPSLDRIEIFGYPPQPDFSTTKLNGKPIDVSKCAQYFGYAHLLNMNCPQLIPLSKNQGFTLTWMLQKLTNTTSTVSPSTPAKRSTTPTRSTPSTPAKRSTTTSAAAPIPDHFHLTLTFGVVATLIMHSMLNVLDERRPF